MPHATRIAQYVGAILLALVMWVVPISIAYPLVFSYALA